MRLTWKSQLQKEEIELTEAGSSGKENKAPCNSSSCFCVLFAAASEDKHKELAKVLSKNTSKADLWAVKNFNT